MTDTGGANALFSSQLTHQLITEGNHIADRLQAHFMTSTSTCQQKSAFYLSFFKEVGDGWGKKSDGREMIWGEVKWAWEGKGHVMG